MRKNLLFISSLLWLFTFTSVAADTKQQQPVVSQQQSETIYGQIFAMQNRLGQLEAGLQQQQGHTEDLKDAEKELQQLKVQLTRLELQLSSQKEVQSNEVSVVSSRVSDAQTSMNWWMGGLALFLAIVSFLTFKHSEQVARKEMQGFIGSHRANLLSDAKKELDSSKEHLEQEIQGLKSQVSSFSREFQEQVEQTKKLSELIQLQTEILDKTAELEVNNVKDQDAETGRLDTTQRRQLELKTTLKPEAEFTAKDWYRRSTAQLANGDYSAALKSIEQVLTDETKLTPLELARFLLRKAACFFYLNDAQQEMATYDELISTFENDTDIKLQELIAEAMLSKGIRLGQLNRTVDEINIYDSLIAKYRECYELPLRENVAKAMFNKGCRLGLQKQTEDAIKVYDDLIAKFDGSSELALLKQVAAAMINKGFYLGQLNQSEEAITIYDILIDRFVNRTELALLSQVAKAMINKGKRLAKKDKTEEAIAVFDDLISKFENSPELELQAQVASAMSSKAIALTHLNQFKEAIDLFDGVIVRYEDRVEPEMKEIVSNAIANQVEAALLIEDASNVIKRISNCEAKIKDPQVVAVMQFLRFILDNKTVDDVLEALKAIPERTELTWSFDEIKPYIVKFKGKKLLQCQALMDFFEEHKDVRQLEATLAAFY